MFNCMWVDHFFLKIVQNVQIFNCLIESIYKKNSVEKNYYNNPANG